MTAVLTRILAQYLDNCRNTTLKSAMTAFKFLIYSYLCPFHLTLTQTEQYVLKISGFVDFVHHPEFYITRKHNWKLDLFPSPGEEKKTPILIGSLGRANLNRWT
jgi:hypothetical protein